MGIIKWLLGVTAYCGTGLFLLGAVAILFDDTSSLGENSIGSLIFLGIALGLGKIGQWFMKPSPNPEATNSTKTEPANLTGGDRLRPIFFHLMQENNGLVTVMQFAIAAEISGTEAKAYLDQQAKEFEAGFNVSETGLITYQFPV